jgi:hypothetical protein
VLRRVDRESKTARGGATAAAGFRSDEYSAAGPDQTSGGARDGLTDQDKTIFAFVVGL